MCANRVEELESRVRELEASVEGLTDELVECKVRLRELENVVDDDLGFVPDTPMGKAKGSEEETAEGAEETKREASDSDTNREESEIIVA